MITDSQPPKSELLEEQAARLRQELWQEVGAPQAPDNMPLERYKHDYQGRHWMHTQAVRAMVERALKIVFCPKCYEQDPRTQCYTGTRLYIRVQDDPMTTFPALAHAECHHCGFEEYWPLKADPRKQAEQLSVAELQLRQAEALRYLEAQHVLAAKGYGRQVPSSPPKPSAGLSDTLRDYMDRMAGR